MPKSLKEKDELKKKEPKVLKSKTDKKTLESKKGKVVNKKVENKEKTLNKKTIKPKKAIASKNESDLNVKDKKVKDKKYAIEYYDLPYRYNETVVKILAQTPKRLFVYWDVSDKDRKRYVKAFGEDFFEKTYPVLLIHNEELNYTFEVPINDFANSWYLDIKDSKTKYVVQLGRKFRNTEDAKEIKIDEETFEEEEKINLQNDFLYITDSNRLEAPNDHILFEKIGNQVTYRNIKNGNEFNKDVKHILEKLEKSYQNPNIKDMYKELYGDNIPEDEEDIISNPTSGEMPTSSFK